VAVEGVGQYLHEVSPGEWRRPGGVRFLYLMKASSTDIRASWVGESE
jgi:hypothetical protein